MPLPTSRISLNQNENAAIRSGLDRILNEFATLRLTGRRSPEVMDSSLKSRLQPRSFTPEHYDLILGLRNRLAKVADSNQSKHRWTVIEFAIIGFAVRVARRFNGFETPAGLEHKIEIHRKRAKRLAITALDKTIYDSAAEGWRSSSRWIRFNLLPRPARGYSYYKPRQIYRQQFRTMLALAQSVVAERFADPLPDLVIAKLVQLIISEIRRGRHPGATVRELVTDELRAKDFLFRVIRKKKEDLKPKFEFMSAIEQSSARAELFRSRMMLGPELTRLSGQKIHSLRFPEHEVIFQVDVFLRHAVAPRYWQTLLSIASTISRNSKPLPAAHRYRGGIEQVMCASQPLGTFEPGFEELEYLAAWLVHFVYQCGADHDACIELLRGGMRLEAERRLAAA